MNEDLKTSSGFAPVKFLFISQTQKFIDCIKIVEFLSRHQDLVPMKSVSKSTEINIETLYHRIRTILRPFIEVSSGRNGGCKLRNKTISLFDVVNYLSQQFDPISIGVDIDTVLSSETLSMLNYFDRTMIEKSKKIILRKLS